MSPVLEPSDTYCLSCFLSQYRAMKRRKGRKRSNLCLTFCLQRRNQKPKVNMVKFKVDMNPVNIYPANQD